MLFSFKGVYSFYIKAKHPPRAAPYCAECRAGFAVPNLKVAPPHTTLLRTQRMLGLSQSERCCVLHLQTSRVGIGVPANQQASECLITCIFRGSIL